MDDSWGKLHEYYKDQDWIDKPSLFAQTAIHYFPKKGSILELGAGQGQDSRFFAENGYSVTASDISDAALSMLESKNQGSHGKSIHIQKVDISRDLPFENESFDVVYAHLSLQYFDEHTTQNIFYEIRRVLKTGGTVAVFVNSVDDPEIKTAQKIGTDYFAVRGVKKRFFSVESLRSLTRMFEVSLLDNLGETYKDSAAGVHNLVRFVGTKPQQKHENTAVPFVGAIIERKGEHGTELLMQTRWKPKRDPIYSGTLEFPAGILDKQYENVYDALAREVSEEINIKVAKITNDSRTEIYHPRGDDAAFAFRPYCCVQQLENGRPWVGFIFLCTVEDKIPEAFVDEAKDAKWMPARDVYELFTKQPHKLFTLELPAWEYYFKEFPPV